MKDGKQVALKVIFLGNPKLKEASVALLKQGVRTRITHPCLHSAPLHWTSCACSQVAVHSACDMLCQSILAVQVDVGG